MGIKTYSPVTPGLRQKATLTFEKITTDKPEKSLTKGKHQKSGRGAGGRISVRRRGGGHKRKLRTIDFKREKFGVPAVVREIEYDPNRSANIALLFYKDGEKTVHHRTQGNLQIGDELMSGPEAPIKEGNALPLENIPVGRNIHNVELQLGKGAQMVRSAGSSALLAAMEGDYATVKAAKRRNAHGFQEVHGDSWESVGNEDHMNVSSGKSGPKPMAW
jgi:large subunit ribosomal protein L2